MSKSIKLKDNNYLDSKSVVHNKQLLSDIVDKLNNSMNKNGINSSTFGIDVNSNYNVGYNAYIFYGGWQQHFMGIVVAVNDEVVGYNLIYNSANIGIESITCKKKTDTISTLTFTFNTTIWGGINILGSKL